MPKKKKKRGIVPAVIAAIVGIGAVGALAGLLATETLDADWPWEKTDWSLEVNGEKVKKRYDRVRDVGGADVLLTKAEDQYGISAYHYGEIIGREDYDARYDAAEAAGLDYTDLTDGVEIDLDAVEKLDLKLNLGSGEEYRLAVSLTAYGEAGSIIYAKAASLTDAEAIAGDGEVNILDGKSVAPADIEAMQVGIFCCAEEDYASCEAGEITAAELTVRGSVLGTYITDYEEAAADESSSSESASSSEASSESASA